ncbi:MAG: hypothetical protein Q8Q67_01675 [bacterium]|nr:hypothetical protein [bacterium]
MEPFIYLFIFGALCFAIDEDAETRVAILSAITACAIGVSALKGVQVAPLIILMAALASVAITSTRFAFRSAVTTITVIGSFLTFQAAILSWFGISISVLAILVILVLHRWHDTVSVN